MKHTAKRHLIAAIALLGMIGSAYALDDQQMKEGYWSVHSVILDQPGNKTIEGKYFICHNHAYDAYVDSLAKTPGCVTKSKSVQGNKHSIEMSCVVAGTTIDSKTTLTYTSDTSSHTESISTYTPAFYGKTSEKMTMDFAYVGSCPAGIQPGDRVNQNGTVMHLWRH